MSRYDDPRWYEEMHDEQHTPSHTGSDDFERYPFLPDAADTSGQQVQQHASTRPVVDPSYQRQRILRQVIMLSALVVVAFFAGWFGNQYFGNQLNRGSQSDMYAQLIQQAWTQIDQNYVDRKAVNYKQMSYAAIQAMVATLQDKGHSRFMDPTSIQNENQQLSGQFTGIGIYLQQDQTTKKLIITAPIPGSPAEKAGIKHGDIIVAVNGTSTAGKDVTATSTLIQGQAGTNVTLTIQRPGVAHTLNVTMTRAQIVVPSVITHYIPEDHIAHIQVAQFSSGVANQLKDAITKAKGQGANKFVLDLRDNPGGYLSEAIDTSSLFMKSGNVLLEQDSTGQRTPKAVSGNALDTTDQIVILVNGNTASAAEIVSGALQDNKRATIIGETTYGTGTVLQQFDLSDGSAILLGVQEWLTPDGHFIRQSANSRGGITPNIIVHESGNNGGITPNQENQANMSAQQILTGNDAQLSAAIKYLQGKK